MNDLPISEERQRQYTNHQCKRMVHGCRKWTKECLGENERMPYFSLFWKMFPLRKWSIKRVKKIVSKYIFGFCYLFIHYFCLTYLCIQIILCIGSVCMCDFRLIFLSNVLFFFNFLKSVVLFFFSFFFFKL